MRKTKTQRIAATLLSLLFIVIFYGAANAQAAAPPDQPVVRAVLFYSPTCGHCEYVRGDIFPPLQTKYGSQLEIVEIDISTDLGYQLFDLTVQKYEVPEGSRGVPFLLIEDNYLVGSVEIPEQFPGIITRELEAEGTSWPQIPEVLDFIGLSNPQTDLISGPVSITSIIAATQEPAITIQVEEPDTPLFILRFQQDVAANSVALVVLLGMVAAMIYTGVAFIRAETLKSWPAWIFPVLIVIGFGVAAYLSSVEVSGGSAICGPVGDCNAVQSSTYARLFGLIHIGVIGMIGYVMIGISWALGRWGKESYRSLANMAVFFFAVSGTLFSIYLTFLEPFVIGATCMWCITSAIVMTMLMLNSTPVALNSWLGFDEEDYPEDE